MSSRMVSLLFMLCFCLSNYGCSRVISTIFPREEELELERQLQNLNKPPVKTIQLEEGDIIDCIDINKQPAFDNPLLKNHKIQLRPTSFPTQMKNRDPVTQDQILEAWSKKEACPDGTVPIHRTTKDDLARAKNVSDQMFRNIGNPNPLPPNIHQVFIKMKETEGVRYYGVWGIGSVYKPNVTLQDQSTSGNVFVKRGPPNELNVLVAGWMVSPSINGDYLTRLFTYWTIDNGQIGCFNLLCSGFVQINPSYTPKMPLSPVSTIGGQIYDMKLAIYQDTQTSNWWLAITDRNITVGYWPKEILYHLRNGAAEVGWGGTAMSQTQFSPPIGSGKYPDGNYNIAAYFRQMHIMRDWLKEAVPTESDPMFEYIGPSGCYGLQNGKDTKVDYWGYRCIYGGPGGLCGP